MSTRRTLLLLPRVYCVWYYVPTTPGCLRGRRLVETFWLSRKAAYLKTAQLRTQRYMARCFRTARPVLFTGAYPQ